MRRCTICKTLVETTYSFYTKKTSKQSLVNRCISCVDGHEFEMGMGDKDK